MSRACSIGYELKDLLLPSSRSIPRQGMIVDETQNLTRHEVKTIISRASEGTKSS